MWSSKYVKEFEGKQWIELDHATEMMGKTIDGSVIKVDELHADNEMLWHLAAENVNARLGGHRQPNDKEFRDMARRAYVSTCKELADEQANPTA